MTRFIHTALLAIIGAIIVHICVLFLIPTWAQNNIWTSLKKSGAPYQFVDLPPDNPIQQSADPLFLLKVCRFNLENGPVHLKALKTQQFWSLAAYTHNGIIFYSLNDRTAPDATLDLIIGKPIQIIELKKSKPKINANSVLVAKNLNEGFVILRIFAPSSLAKKKVKLFFHQRPATYFMNKNILTSHLCNDLLFNKNEIRSIKTVIFFLYSANTRIPVFLILDA